MTRELNSSALSRWGKWPAPEIAALSQLGIDSASISPILRRISALLSPLIRRDGVRILLASSRVKTGNRVLSSPTVLALSIIIALVLADSPSRTPSLSSMASRLYLTAVRRSPLSSALNAGLFPFRTYFAAESATEVLLKNRRRNSRKFFGFFTRRVETAGSTRTSDRTKSGWCAATQREM